jgi:thymidylate kinase
MGEPLRDDLVFVEFVGLPGAGKSTISRELISSLIRKGVKVATIEDIISTNWRNSSNPEKMVGRFTFYLFYVLRQAAFVRHILRYIVRTRPFSLADSLRTRHMFGLDEVYRKVSFGRFSDGYDIAICEDGFLQVIWSLTSMRRVPSDEDVGVLLEFLCSRHQIYPVYLLADPQTSLERMLGRERPRSRIAFRPRDEALQRLERQQEAIRCLYQVSSRISRRGGLCIPASQSVSGNVDAIVEEVLKFLDDDRAGDPDAALTDSVSVPQL